MAERPRAMDERIAERRAEVRRDEQLRRRRRTVRVAVALLVLVVLVAVERSPLVGLEEIEVVGTERLTAAEVREAADLAPGTSTLRLRLRAVEERVAGLPLVAAADASRVDPLTVRIAVTERVPALRLTGDPGWLLDREGTVLAPADGSVEVPAGAVRVVASGEVPAPGEGPEGGSPLAAAVGTWRGLTGALRAEVTLVRADAAAEVLLELRDGTEVRWGRAERHDEKSRALGAVLEDLAGAQVTTIDVTAPGRPSVAP